jgi:hypothetical protein
MSTNRSYWVMPITCDLWARAIRPRLNQQEINILITPITSRLIIRLATFGPMTDCATKASIPELNIAYFGKEGNLKYDVIVSAGADANVLKMQYDGADALYLKNGKLIVVNAFNSVEESIPLAYQTINGTQKSVACRYVLNGTTVSFEFPNGYDSSKELVIDPTLVFSSYTGSTANNFGFTATYDQKRCAVWRWNRLRIGVSYRSRIVFSCIQRRLHRYRHF